MKNSRPGREENSWSLARRLKGSGSGTQAGKHAEQPADFGEAENKCAGEVNNAVGSQDHNGGNDRISGGESGDVLSGDGGNDSISGDGGRDKISGGRGDDRIDAADRIGDVIAGGPGRDSARTDPVDRTSSIEVKLK